MHQPSDDELPLKASPDAARAHLAARCGRCMRVAKALAISGAGGVLFLCLWGLRPAAVAIPVFSATTCVLLGSAAAALFARLAYLHASDDDDGSDDDGRGPGRGPEPDCDPPTGGGAEFDWERFEREFRAYAERGPAVPA